MYSDELCTVWRGLSLSLSLSLTHTHTHIALVPTTTGAGVWDDTWPRGICTKTATPLDYAPVVIVGNPGDTLDMCKTKCESVSPLCIGITYCENTGCGAGPGRCWLFTDSVDNKYIMKGQLADLNHPATLATATNCYGDEVDCAGGCRCFYLALAFVRKALIM